MCPAPGQARGRGTSSGCPPCLPTSTAAAGITTMPMSSGTVAVWLARLVGAMVVLFQPAHVQSHGPHDVVTGLAADESGTVVLAVTRKRVYQSVDSGLSWRLAGGGLGDFTAREKGTCAKAFTSSRLSIRFAPSAGAYGAGRGLQKVFLIEPRGLWVSHDSGLSFSLRWLAKWWQPFTGAMAVSPINAKHLEHEGVVAGSTYVHICRHVRVRDRARARVWVWVWV